VAGILERVLERDVVVTVRDYSSKLDGSDRRWHFGGYGYLVRWGALVRVLEDSFGGEWRRDSAVSGYGGLLLRP